jgi:uncharacterized protein
VNTSKPTAKEITDISKARGYLAKQLYVIFTTPAGGPEAVLQNLQPHFAYQDSLIERGVLFASGPNWTDDEQEWNGEGMVVVRAASLSEAETIARKDPMHASGARSFRIRPWLVNLGTIEVKLDYTTGRFQLT